MRRFRMLAACECSGRVRDAFAARGWEAWSADLLPAESAAETTVESYEKNGQRKYARAHRAAGVLPGTGHYIGDVRDLFLKRHPVNYETYLERQHWVPRNADGVLPVWDLVIAFPPCFPAGTPVLTSRGMLPIEQVAAGDRVLTHKGRWQPVTRTMSRQHDLVSDGVTTATPDHPFYTRKQNPVRYASGTATPFTLADPEWTEAQATEGHFLAIPLAVEPLSVPEVGGREIAGGFPFWYMVGRWLGDGWLRVKEGTRSNGPDRQRNDVIICSGHAEADELELRLKKTGLAWHRVRQRTTVRFTASHFELSRWFRQHFGEGAAGKTIPAWLLGMSEADRYAVMRGYRDADGYKVSESRQSASSISQCLAVGVRLLATSLGYTTGLYRAERLVHEIEGRRVKQRPAWIVHIRHDDGWFTRVDKLHRWVKQRKPMLPAGRGTVYDITVAEDHSFVANGYVVHNCTHLSLAGAVHWKAKRADGRQDEAAKFFTEMAGAPAPFAAVENPRGDMTRRWRAPDQYVQPWMFGDPLAKLTGLWLKNLPLLVPDNVVEPAGRVATGGGSWRTDQKHGRGASNGHEDSEGRRNRQTVRNRTLPGLARAMASQWGSHVEKERA